MLLKKFHLLLSSLYILDHKYPFFASRNNLLINKIVYIKTGLTALLLLCKMAKNQCDLN